MEHNTLYRFFGAGDHLLYVGITNHIPNRFRAHSKEKPWWDAVTKVTMQHFASRAAVEEAERVAVRTESPQYNIQHARGRERAVDTPATPAKAGTPANRWQFESLRSGYERTCDLYLYAELNCSACVDDVHGWSGDEQVSYYVDYLERNYPEWWDTDAVPIYWSVRSDEGGIAETAPFQQWDLVAPDLPDVARQDFLHHFSWPHNEETDEPLDWFQLEVRMDRFTSFAQALGWKPSPLQPFAPLKSLMYSRWRSSPHWLVRSHPRPALERPVFEEMVRRVEIFEP